MPAAAAVLFAHCALAAAAMDSAPIAALQTELRAAGYDPGPVNGVMTPKTERALAAYQRAHHAPLGAGDPVRSAQQTLASLGFLSGPADGVLGPSTRDAIIRFQAANHLPIDPRVSDHLLAELDRAAAPPAAAAAPPAPGPGAAALPGPAAAQPAEPEAEGRQALPAGVAPPPIR
jgi:peptidoglycan hydrolase-like protein with peptidoglycan-binding domain